MAELKDQEPEQEALIQLEGPDGDGFVWACSPDGRDIWCQNLGPTKKVAEVMSQWLRSIDYDEQDELTPEAIEAGKRQAKIDRKAARLEDNRERGRPRLSGGYTLAARKAANAHQGCRVRTWPLGRKGSRARPPVFDRHH